MRSYIKEKLVWTPKGSSNSYTIDYIIDYSDNETVSPVNNKATIKVYDVGNILIKNGVFLPKSGDLMVFYSKEVFTNDTEFSDSDILWTGLFIDHDYNETSSDGAITLQVIDLGFKIFNRFWNRSYVSRGLRTNQIIVDIIENMSEDIDGYGEIEIDTSNIATTRNDGTPFPIIEPVFITKPVHEWVTELSSREWTNTPDELLGEEVIKKPMLFKILGAKAYWIEQPTTSIFTISNTTYVNSMKQSTQEEGEVNYLILDCGEDFDSRPIKAYLFNEESTSSITKERFESVPKIAGINQSYDNDYHSLRKDYSLTTNTDFRKAVRKLAESRKAYWFNEFGKGKTQIAVSIPLTDIPEVNSIVTVTRDNFEKGDYRIKTKSNKSNTKSRTTSLQLEKI